MGNLKRDPAGPTVRRARPLTAALGLSLGGLGTAGLLSSAAWAGGPTPLLARPGLGRSAAIGIGPAYHTMAPPLVHFGPAGRCAQRRHLVVTVRARRGQSITLLSLGRDGHQIRPHRRRAPLAVVLRRLPRGRFALTVRLRVVTPEGSATVRVRRRFGACSGGGTRNRLRPPGEPETRSVSPGAAAERGGAVP